MKLKLLIVGMLLLSLIVLSGCDSYSRIESKKCFHELADKICKEKGYLKGETMTDWQLSLERLKIYCYDDERDISFSKTYKFTEEDIDYCIKWK